MSQQPGPGSIGPGGVFGLASNRAPDLIGSIVGFRIFKVGERSTRLHGRHDTLLSTFLGAPWEPGWNRARCKWHTYVELMGQHGNVTEHPERPAMHEAPHQFCACGFYAYHKQPKSREHAHAIVELKGRLQVHRSGVRAQHARVLALAAPDSMKGLDMEPRLRVIARRWGIPFLSVHELWANARDYGEGVPDALRP